MNCLCCTLCSLFPIHTSLCLFYREVLISTPSLFYISTNLPPRQVVRRSLLFFFVSLPSCEKSFYCRVSPNCVGRDECGDPNRNDLTTYLSEIKQQVVIKYYIETRHSVSKRMFDNFLLFFTMDRATCTICTLVQAKLDPQRRVGGLVANAGRSTRKNH